MSRTRITLGVLVVFAVVLAFWLWPRGESPGGAGSASPTNESSVTTAARTRSEATTRATPERERLASQPASSAPRSSLQITAVWKQDRAAAQGVGLTVALEDGDGRRELVTDERGRARFEGLLPGRTIVATDRGTHAEVELAAGTAQEVTLELDAGITLAGSVVDWQGTPVSGAEIWLGTRGLEDAPIPRELQRVARSDRRGEFQLRGMRRGHELFARKAGLAPSAREWLRDGQDSIRLVIPARGTSLCVRVLADGRPLEGATVRAWLARAEGTPYVFPERMAPTSILRTDAAGRSCADDLPAGTTHVFAEARGRQRAEKSLVLELGKTGALEIELAAAGNVHGRVRDRDGRPVRQAWVRLETEGATHRDYVDATPDGFYRFDHATPGYVRLRFEAHGRRGERRDLTLGAGQTLVCDVTLDPSTAPMLRGRLQDEAARPLEGWWLQAIPRNEDPHGWMSGKSDGKGRFTIEVRPGLTYSLRIQETPSKPWIACTDLAPLVASQDEVVVTIQGRDRPSAFVSGKLVDDSGAPLPRAALALSDALGVRFEPEFHADDLGAFRIGPLTRGNYVLRTSSLEVASSDVAPADLVRFELAPNEDKELGTLPVRRGTLITYRVLDPEGKKLTGIGGMITGEDGVPVAGLREKAGHGQIRLLPGRYRLTVAGIVGWAGKCVPLEVVAGGEQRLDIVCERGVARALRFRWPNGARPTSEQSAKISYALPRGATWEFGYLVVEPDEDLEVNACLAVGRHEVTITLADSTLYTGRFELATLAPTREAIQVPLELVR